MAVCPTCRVAYLDGERHQCASATVKRLSLWWWLAISLGLSLAGYVVYSVLTFKLIDSP